MDTSITDFTELTLDLGNQCGEVFLNAEGNLSFVCTFCKTKHEEYQSYADHIVQNHYISSTSWKWEFPTLLNHEEEFKNFTKCIFSEVQLKEAFQLIDNIEFFAPVPDNCHEIEEYSARVKHLKTALCSQNTFALDKENESIKKTVMFQLEGNSKNSKIRIYRCPECNLSCKTNTAMSMHISRHLGERKHFCLECKKGFYTRTELRTHKRVHTGVRPFLCQDCGQTFVTSSALWRHNKSCRNVRDKECPECKMKFYDSVGLRNHMVVHSENRLHKCMLCSARFKLRKYLRTHMKIHENKMEYKCQHCPASFNQQPGLFSHIRHNHCKISFLKT